MFEKVQQWQTKRTITKAVKDAIEESRGVAAHVWLLTPASTAAERTQTAELVTTWIAEQLPYTATPHGINDYTVSLGFAAVDGAERTYLGQQKLAQFKRHAVAAALESVQAQIIAVDLHPYPTMTHLEVYLFSFGDMIKPVLDAKAQQD